MTLGCRPLIVSNHLATFNRLRPSDSRDITYLIYHVIPCDNVFKGLCDFITYLNALPSLMARDLVVVAV